MVLTWIFPDESDSWAARSAFTVLSSFNSFCTHHVSLVTILITEKALQQHKEQQFILDRGMGFSHSDAGLLNSKKFSL